ncbi:dTDP-4-amino-4,6-dideoxygalactose transaminase [Kushneria sinocarnis]|uniref:dTDP-4-amino-4,6-dideoxygalactose transaminase n=1 Tax=Kushneria sinocarnis TaxID=595502 RepID=A0A420WWA1_9GAMM|nr:DegT/DnrJ/EryC1/StrS family aminotransferase [Kushneria sinocarnis]RKR03360.1 dTDP-4-amino-4,6-dideoxygalactose transaminase [Kushneria sinocarnis]
MIPVTRPFMPPEADYIARIGDIYRAGQWTNHGPQVREFEQRITALTGVRHFHYIANGTIALQLALKALPQQGEVITTPFSFVATLSSIVWEGFTPRFVDIDPDTLNIDAGRIEAAITERTVAILATHVYGNPCDIHAIQAIADRHGLKVIYDAAHCFGTLYQGRSVFNYGDISITSFHATKLFHTIEGGGLFTNDAELSAALRATREFGQVGQEGYMLAGINGKNSEVHAAMGLTILPWLEAILARRSAIARAYDERFAGSGLQRPAVIPGTRSNHAYYPILFASEQHLLDAVERLAAIEVVPRRYFAPSLNTLAWVPHAFMPVAEDVAARVLCLPSYHELDAESIDRIADAVLDGLPRSANLAPAAMPAIHHAELTQQAVGMRP